MTPEQVERDFPNDHERMATFLRILRMGKRFIPGQEPEKLSALEVQSSLVASLRIYLTRGGEFFRVPDPYYFDRREMRLIRVDPKSARWLLFLDRLGFLTTQGHTNLVVANLQNTADAAPEKKRHRFAFAAPDNSAIYFFNGESDMVRVTEDKIDLVPMGTGGAFLLADDLKPWPALDEVLLHMDTLRPLIGRACTRLVPGSPMTRHLTARWSSSGQLTHDQQHWLWLMRMLFLTVGNRYGTWPLTLILGEQNSGKSTAPERMLAAIMGEPTDLQALPEKADSLIASLTNRAMCVYDNIDGFCDDHGRTNFSNTFCLVATGGTLELRKLYTTNSLVSQRVQNHVWFTSRTQPFERDDLLRRVLRLETSAAGVEDGDKDSLIEQAAEDRTTILAEWALRAQNMLRAHRQCSGVAYKPVTRMGPYEKYSRIMAEYEGTADETEALWRAYMDSYFESITESNPCVVAIQYWLGEDPAANNGRWISPLTLFTELKAVYAKLGLEQGYRSVNAFGLAIRKHETPLRQLGIERRRTKASNDCRFSVDTDTLAQFHTQYVEALRARAKQGDLRDGGFNAQQELQRIKGAQSSTTGAEEV